MSEGKTLSVEELKKRLDANQVDFLFDLRNTDEFRSWRIEGRSDFPALNIPQEEFVGEEADHLAKFPRDREIVVVCAHGDAAKYEADQLQGLGLNVASLVGGMDAWSELYETHKVNDDPAIYQIYRAARGCIGYLIVSQGMAVAIDVARHIDRIRDLAASLNAKLTAVLDTHLHADHISGGRDLASQSGAEYYLHPGDAGGAAISYVPLVDGQRLTFGAGVIDVIHSPGHTPGSTSFLVNKTHLLTGDTIMKTSMGRPDLGGKADEWAALLYDTLFRRFRGLGDEVVVLPSHASSPREQDRSGVIKTTMGEARKEGDLFQIQDKAAFTRYIKANLLENPERYQEMRKVNLGMLQHEEAKKKELEIGKNLCGMAKQDGPGSSG